MRKTRLTYFISLLLTILLMVTPLCVVHADEGVTGKAKRDNEWSPYVGVTVKNTTDKTVSGWTMTISCPK